MASEYRIVHFGSPQSYGTFELRDKEDNDPIGPPLIDLLFQYREILGVMAIRKVNSIITWELNNSWYSSEEIDRMLKLKIFS